MKFHFLPRSLSIIDSPPSSPDTLTCSTQGRTISSTEAFSLNNMEELDTSSSTFVIYRGKANLVGLVGISVVRSCVEISLVKTKGKGRGKYRRETTLAPPLSRWRKGRDDKSKRNAVDVWYARFDARSNFLFPSLFHLNPLIHRFPS